MKHKISPVPGYEGLDQCDVCRGAECELPTECPGLPMTGDRKQDVCDGKIDFVGGVWFDKKMISLT